MKSMRHTRPRGHRGFAPVVEEVWLRRGTFFEPNVYLAGDSLVDGVPFRYALDLVAALRGHNVARNIFTHTHSPCQGSANVVRNVYECETICGAGDQWGLTHSVHFYNYPPTISTVLFNVLMEGEPTQVDRLTKTGESFEGFEVIESPGHSLGHIVLWRESDRTLICGDVLVTRSIIRQNGRLRLPPARHTKDPELNQRSAERLIQMQPHNILPAHGAPILGRDSVNRKIDEFVSFTERLN